MSTHDGIDYKISQANIWELNAVLLDTKATTTETVENRPHTVIDIVEGTQLSHLKVRAHELGGDAVVAVRHEKGHWYGTAVRLDR